MTDFFKQVAPVLAANLLTVLLVYSIVSYDRMKQPESGAGVTRLMAVVLVGGFLLFGLYAHGAFTATPFRHLVDHPRPQP
jgi:hypothetical protein